MDFVFHFTFDGGTNAYAPKKREKKIGKRFLKVGEKIQRPSSLKAINLRSKSKEYIRF